MAVPAPDDQKDHAHGIGLFPDFSSYFVVGV